MCGRLEPQDFFKPVLEAVLDGDPSFEELKALMDKQRPKLDRYVVKGWQWRVMERHLSVLRQRDEATLKRRKALRQHPDWEVGLAELPGQHPRFEKLRKALKAFLEERTEVDQDDIQASPIWLLLQHHLALLHRIEDVCIELRLESVHNAKKKLEGERRRLRTKLQQPVQEEEEEP